MKVLALWLVHCNAYAGEPVPPAIQNNAYRLSAEGNFIKVERKNSSVSRTIEPAICVLFSTTDPGFGPGQLSEERTPAAGWKKKGGGYETDLFAVSDKITVKSDRIIPKGANAFQCSFPEQDGFTLEMTIELPAGNATPLIRWQLTPKKEGWYSVGFVGIANRDAASLDFLYLPLVWQWKRFPLKSCLTTESYCTTAATYTNVNNASEGITPDPAEIPYRYARFEQSRFGLALRDEEGKAKPMLFAPILGAAESKRKVGEQLKFSCRYFLSPGDWYAGLNEALYGIFKYRNERQNANVSLNTTFENMVDYAMDDYYAGWVPELKGFNYSWDVPGTVKVVSALHPLSIALTTGNMEIYRRRAVPLMEYVMSREKYLYSVHDSITSQNPSHNVKGPCVEIGELAGLYNITGGKSYVFRGETDRIFGKPRKLNLLTESGGGTWQDYLARYRMTGDKADLEKAKSGAMEHYRDEIERFPDNFNNAAGLLDKKSAFYTDFVPRANDYLELYEETGDKKFLQAAATGARGLLYWMRSNPMAPDSLIVVNKGGKVPGVFEGRRISQEVWEYFNTETAVPERIVPAWQTSLVGITPEQPGTLRVAGPIMLASHAPWLLRIAALTNDTLLRDGAYNSVLGRYANFPGYYFTNLRTNVYQQSDYPLHPYKELTYNAFFYNHVWPHIAMIQDFLVSDAFYRSGGKVNFPSGYAPGYAFLASKIYGQKPGTIYGTGGLNLWLPKRALKSTNSSFNHIMGIGKNELFIVLMNTARTSQAAEFVLDAEKIPWNAGQTYSITLIDKAGKSIKSTMRNGRFTASAPANGIVTVHIDGLRPDVPLHHKIEAAGLATTKNYVRVNTGKEGLGNITGMLLNMTPDFSDAYIYSDIPDKNIRKMIFRYKLGNKAWKELTDNQYPFEFSLHLDNPSEELLFTLESFDAEGNQFTSDELKLTNHK